MDFRTSQKTSILIHSGIDELAPLGLPDRDSLNPSAIRLNRGLTQRDRPPSNYAHVYGHRHIRFEIQNKRKIRHRFPHNGLGSGREQ